MRIVKLRLLLLFVVVAIVWGSIATYLWLSHSDVRQLGLSNPLGIFLCLAVVTLLTCLSLAVRWLRWHFLTRRIGIRLGTRLSIKLYLATLAGIVTPFCIGELARAFLLRRIGKGAFWGVATIWFTERLSDTAAIGILLLLSRGHGLLALLAVVIWVGFVMIAFSRPRSRIRDDLSGLFVAVSVILASALAWAIPVAALWFAVGHFGAKASFGTSAEAFARGTLLGGVAGVPLGTGVTGVQTIDTLLAAGVSQSAAAVTTLVFRLGTAWFALGIGLAAFFGWRKYLYSELHPDGGRDHFDEISQVYSEQIPLYVRERLLQRKTARMLAWLNAAGFAADASGLDVGCGQGWYAGEMARAGYEMSGVDSSEGQIQQARILAASDEASLRLEVGDALALPFGDCSFDFAYAINVLHHVGDSVSQGRAYEEIVRVLKPGGVFFLHEINVENPLFRFYMSYVFPVLGEIDEGTEAWIRPSRLPQVPGAGWSDKVAYFTFLPDWAPPSLAKHLFGLESRLERSRFRSFSAHYMAALIKD